MSPSLAPSVNPVDVLRQARKSRITELWEYSPKFSRIGGLSPCHGRNDERIGLFARKSDVEMFRASFPVFSFPPAARKRQGKLAVARANGKRKRGLTALGMYP